MILSRQSIYDRCKEFQLKNLIFPFWGEKRTHEPSGNSYGLGECGYDIRVAQDIFLWPKTSCLASSIEHFSMPLDLQGEVADKSSLARRFVTVQNTKIEPGWRGHLTLEIINHSWKFHRILAGAPIAQIVFHLLDKPTNRPYVGKYQDQPPRPVASIKE